MKKHFKLILLVVFIMLITSSIYSNEEFNQWRKEQQKSFENFRSKQDEDFASYLKTNWEAFSVFKGEKQDDEPKPVNIPTLKPTDRITTEQSSIKISPIELPPEPVEIEVENETHFYDEFVPENSDIDSIEITFSFWGLPLKIRLNEMPKIKLKENINKEVIADFWYQTGNYDMGKVITQLIQQKERLNLTDWSYCKLVDQFATKLTDETALKRLYCWYFLVKSGFDIKVGYNTESVSLLVPTNKTMYGVSYLNINEKKYYLVSLDSKNPVSGQINTYSKQYPESVDLVDLEIKSNPKIASKIVAKDYNFKYNNREYTITINFDESTARFFKDYPQTELSVYFKAPLTSEAEYSLIEQFNPLLEGQNQSEALNILLRFVQTAFAYQTDDEQFGREKPLTSVETLYYDSSDCEDRSVLFSYLVKRLLNIEVLVLDYPGHIATAVKLDESVPGDIIVHNNDSYLICDPTYINANIGMTMPRFKNKKPVILTF